MQEVAPPNAAEAIAQLLVTAARVFEEQTDITSAGNTSTDDSAAGTESRSKNTPLQDTGAMIAARRKLLEQTPNSLAERQALQKEALGIVTSLLTNTTPLLSPRDIEFIKKRCLVLRCLVAFMWSSRAPADCSFDSAEHEALYPRPRKECNEHNESLFQQALGAGNQTQVTSPTGGSDEL